MTFKHTKFEDSAIMRSFEKLSLEKGLVKNDLLKKIASRQPKLDLSPGDNLVENLLKLCAGLREDGFEKYANELESAFMLYKQAEASECDNDILEQAHPKGSYKLEGVSGDAVVETIIDQHLSNMKMVNKMPTGKLTTASEIINAVRKLIKNAQELDEDVSSMIVDDKMIPLRKREASKTIKKIIGLLNSAKKIIDQNFGGSSLQGSFNRNYNELYVELSDINEETATVDKFSNIITDLDDILNSLSLIERLKAIIDPTSIDPSVYTKQMGHGYDLLTGKQDTENRNKIISLISRAKQIAQRAKSIAKGELDSVINKNVQETTPALNQNSKLFYDKFKSLMNEFNRISIKFADNPKVKEWSNKHAWNLQTLSHTYNESTHESCMKSLAKEEDLISKFKAEWE